MLWLHCSLKLIIWLCENFLDIHILIIGLQVQIIIFIDSKVPFVRKKWFLGLNPNLSKLIWWSGSRAVPQSQRIIIWTKGKSAFCTNRTFNLSITSISCFNNSVMVKSSDVMPSFFNPRIQSLQLYKTGKLSILKNWNNFLFFQRKKWQWKWLLKRHFWIMKLVEVPLSKKN